MFWISAKLQFASFRERKRERQRSSVCRLHYRPSSGPMIEINFKSISPFINLPCQNNQMTRWWNEKCRSNAINLITFCQWVWFLPTLRFSWHIRYVSHVHHYVRSDVCIDASEFLRFFFSFSSQALYTAINEVDLFLVNCMHCTFFSH